MKQLILISFITFFFSHLSIGQLLTPQSSSTIQAASTIFSESPENWLRESFGEWEQDREEVSLRDQNSKHFRNSDGSFSAIIAAGNLHYWENQRWNTIFHSIETNSSGFHNLTNGHKTFYPATSANSLRTILPDGTEMRDMIGMRMYFLASEQEIYSQGILGTNGNVNFNVLTYPNVYGDGIDLRLTQETTKRKMDYIIGNLGNLGPIPQSADFLVFEEKVELPFGYSFQLIENNILIFDDQNNIKVIYEKPIFKDAPQLDSEGHYRSNEAEGIYVVIQNGNLLTIQTKVQLDWLINPERNFPVLIDPTVNLYPNNTSAWSGYCTAYHADGSSSADAPIYSSSSLSNGYNDYIIVGRTSTNYSYQSYVKFNISSLPSSCINSVNLNYRVSYNYSSGSDCNVMARLRHLATEPVGNTWANRLTDIRDGNIYETRQFRCYDTGSGWVNAPMTSNLSDLEASMPGGWFGVGFHTFQGGSHATCYTEIYGYSSSSRPYLVVDYTPYYQVQFSNPTPTTFCANQTQQVSVTVTNVGCMPWTSGWTLPNTVNFSWWGSWQSGGLAGGQDNNPRMTPFINLAPGQSQVVTFDITAPSTPGSYSIQTDLVRDAVCWFRNNGSPSCGPGNINYLIPITVYDALIVDAGTDLTSCSGNSVILNGSVSPATYSSSATATFNGGNGSTLYSSSPTTATNSTCPINLSVNIPVGATITSVNVNYTMTAQNGGWRSEQRSYLQCTSPGGLKEGSVFSGAGDSGGGQGYNRTGLNIANGVVGGGTINFQLHAFRTWGGSNCEAYYNYVNNNSFTVTVYYTVPIPVSWSGGPIVSGGNTLAPTVNPTSSSTYTLTATSIGCSMSDQITVAIAPGATAPSSVSATHPLHPEYCHGNTINLTSVGGTPAGGNVVNVWYENSCNTVVEETWSNSPAGRPGWWMGSTIVNSANGILNVSSTGVDPMIFMGNLSINPNVYRYVQVRYRYVSGPTNPGIQVFFENGSGLAEARSQRGTMIMDGNWHFLNLDMSVNYSGANSGWVGGPTVTGLRFDFCESTGMTMEFDFLLVSQDRMLSDQTTLLIDPSSPYYPTSSTQYFTKKIDDCGVTSCVSSNVNLPPIGTTLALNNESATCYVYANETIRYYHSSGRYIASVTASSNTLGATIATNYLEPSYLLVPACDMPSLDIAVMKRHWVITPASNGAATVRLPYYLAELADLGAGSAISTSVEDLVVSPDNSNVVLSKYSGGDFPSTFNVNNDPYDNCVVGGTTLHYNIGVGNNTPVTGINAMYSDFSIPGFSEFWLHGMSGSALPVELNSFAAQCNSPKEEVLVRWATATEQNSSHFSVERSVDGINWNTLTSVDAAGNSVLTQVYEVKDYDVRGYQMIYYRLQQFDQDGSIKQYGPVSVSCSDDSNDWMVFPNPAGNEVTILLKGQYDASTQINITDINGKEMQTISYHQQQGQLITVDLRSYAPGVYIVRLQDGVRSDQFVRLIKK